MQTKAESRKDLKTEIEDAARVLIGLEASIIRHAGNMRGIHFGKTRESKGTIVGAYALHIQCPWRVECRGKIVTGFHDYYVPGSRVNMNTWDPDSARGSLQEDRLFEVFNVELDLDSGRHVGLAGGRFVRKVEGDRFGGLLVGFTGGILLRVFPAASSGEEWRLLQPEKRPATS